MKIIRYSLAVLFFATVIFLLPTDNVSAGFGISPPYLKNQQLVPGSKYEQKITLLRSSADEDLKANLKINAPEIEEWITIDKGEEFVLPKGELQVPMLVAVNVPKDAELGNYKGQINIKISSQEEKDGGGVAIALGARVDIDLTLTNVSYADFLVRAVSIPDFEILGKPWKWKIFSKFLHRISVVMSVENTGNIKTAPSKVSIEVYDIAKNKILESSVDKSIKKIKPFSTGETVAYFPTKLGPGQYWGKLKVYKDNNIVNTYEIAFTIANKGELPGGGPDLGIYPWLLLAAYITIAVIILTVLVKFRSWRLAIITLVLIFKTFIKPALNKLSDIFNSIKIKFWKWISRKASKHFHDNNDKE